MVRRRSQDHRSERITPGRFKVGINEVLRENDIPELLYATANGICIFTAAFTDLALPNGDFIDRKYYHDLRSNGWIDSQNNYTIKFFESHKKSFPYKDKDGNIHALSAFDLVLANKEGNTKAIAFLKNLLPESIQGDVAYLTKTLTIKEKT